MKGTYAVRLQWIHRVILPQAFTHAQNTNKQHNYNRTAHNRVQNKRDAVTKRTRRVSRGP